MTLDTNHTTASAKEATRANEATTKTEVPAQRDTGRPRPVGAELGARLAYGLGSRFRLPRPDDPAPRQRRLAGICGWAAGLGLAGLLVGLLALVAMVGTTAGWYEPTVIAIGLAGILCTIGALASIHRYRLPWLLLGAASAALLAALAITLSV